MRITKKKVAAVAAGAAVVLAGGGLALAYWTANGTGSGSATTGTDAGWSVTSDAAVGDPLTPNGPTDTIAVHVKNPSSGVQHLNTVTVAVKNDNGTTWSSVSGCSAADYDVTVNVAPGDVAAGATVSGTATIKMVDTGSNQNGCKNATVPLYFVAS